MELQRLTWRFGVRAFEVEARHAAGTWTLTCRGGREDLVESNLNFAKAAERLRARIEAKLKAHAAR